MRSTHTTITGIKPDLARFLGMYVHALANHRPEHVGGLVIQHHGAGLYARLQGLVQSQKLYTRKGASLRLGIVDAHLLFAHRQVADEILHLVDSDMLQAYLTTQWEAITDQLQRFLQDALRTAQNRFDFQQKTNHYETKDHGQAQPSR